MIRLGLLFFGLIFSLTSSALQMPLLVMDGQPKAHFPKRFRILNHIHAIGSGQFSKSQLLRIKHIINAPILVVDLRQESHGFFDDLPISWYGPQNWANQNLSPFQINQKEQTLLTNSNNSPPLQLHSIRLKSQNDVILKTETVSIQPVDVASEEETVKRLGLQYHRFYIPDHDVPTTSQIMRFKKLIQSLPANTWVYFHCRGGSGRTTTFMVLYEIFKKGRLMPLEQLLEHHHRSGGKDLKKLPDKSSYKWPLAKARYDLIQKIYSH